MPDDGGVFLVPAFSGLGAVVRLRPLYGDRSKKPIQDGVKGACFSQSDEHMALDIPYQILATVEGRYTLTAQHRVVGSI